MSIAKAVKTFRNLAGENKMYDKNNHLSLLGCRVADSVTGYTGVVSSISYDLYGCIQAVVTPRMDEKGEIKNGNWFDITRLKVLDPKPVMAIPNFSKGYVAEGRKGAAEKPEL